MADQTTHAVVTGANYNVLSDVIKTIYAREIEFQAQPALRFEQFADKKTELGVTPGRVITMITYDNLGAGGALTEGTAMETKYMASSTVNITVVEYGNAIAVSEYLLQVSFDDIMSSATKLLGHDYQKILDGILRDAAYTTTNVKYAYSGGVAAANRAAISATHLFSTDVVKDSAETLATANTPYVDGSGYVCIVHPHQARAMRDDSAWINASNYGAPEQLFKGEIGKYENVRFIETTQISTVSSTVTVYKAIMLGLAGYGWAVGLPVEMRDNGVQDFGRVHSLAWYSIMGAGKLNNGRMCVLESA